MRISASPLELNPATANDPAKIEKVARQLEGQFAQMLIKSMRDASFGDSLFPGENQMFREMYDKQLAEAMTKGRGLGLSTMIARQLGGGTAESTPATDTSLVRPADAARAYRLASPAAVGMPLAAPATSMPVTDPLPLLPGESSGQLMQPMEQTLDLIAGRDSHRFHERIQSGSPYSVPPAGATIADALPLADDRWQAVGADSTRAGNAGSVIDRAAANSAAAQLGANTPEGFVASIWPHAERAARELGVNPRALVAQAALETGWGRKHIRRDDGGSAHNLFGIKANGWKGDRATTRTHEYVDGVRRNETASFRAYASAADSFSDYVRMLKNSPRYQSALKAGGDVRGFAQGLQQAGYATDPSYAAKIAAIATGPTIDRAVAAIGDAGARLARNFASNASLPGPGVTRR